MSAPISPISLPAAITAPDVSSGLANSTGASFQKIFESAVQSVEGSASTADKAVSNYLAGGEQELHSTILATQNADLNFQMFMQVRNKVVSAYEEIMKMQI